MRITGVNSVVETYKSQVSKVKEAQPASKAKDVVNISETAKEYQVAQKAINTVADVREDKVNELQKRLESGNYNVNALEAAETIVNRFFDKMI